MKKALMALGMIGLILMNMLVSSAETLLDGNSMRALESQIIVGNQIWMINEYAQTICRMDIDGSVQNTYSSIEDTSAADGFKRYRSTLSLLSHDESVYAIKASYRRDIQYEDTILEDVHLFKIYDGSAMVNEPIVKLDWASAQQADGQNTYSPSIKSAAMLGDMLHVLFYDLEDNYQVFSLKTGARQQIDLNRRALCLSARAEQIAVAATNESGQVEIWRTEDGNWKQFAALPNEITHISALSFADDAAYFVESGMLCSVDAGNEVHKLRSVPSGINRGYIQGDIFYAFTNDNLYRFNLSVQTVERKLRIYRGRGSRDAIDAFRVDFPDVAIENVPRMEKEELYTQILSHSANIDLIGSHSYNLPVYKDMVQRGYCAPIASEALNEFARNCYPSVQDVLFVDGQLVGVPVGVIPSFQMGVHRTLWKSLGLDEAPPKTWSELLTFINETWPGLQDAYPEVCAISREGYELMFPEMLDDYLYYRSKQAEDPGYDTPLFREAMQLYLSSEPEQFPSEEYNDAQPLFMADLTFTPEDNGFLDDYDYLPIGYTEEYGSKALMALELMTIGQDSQNKELCEQYLEYLVAKMDPVSLTTLQINQNDPVKDPAQQAFLAELEAERNAMQSAMDAMQDSAEKTAMGYELQNLNKSIEAFLESGWLISPESIAAYRSAVQDQFVLWDDALNERENEFRSELIDNVNARTIDVDRVVAKLNQLYYMRILEDKG